MQRIPALLCLACALSANAFGSTIALTGNITQSTADGTGPAVSNPSLNKISDGQTFTLTLNPTVDVTGPGLYTLTGSALSFVVAVGPAAESNFGSILLSVIANGSSDDFSLLACLAGADCPAGNLLSVNFSIASDSIGGSNVPVVGLDQPHPLDLLEDGGNTDIHASILAYSNTALTKVTPEPASGFLCATALAALFAVHRIRSTYRSRRSV